jgi:hypothetical membrane protein
MFDDIMWNPYYPVLNYTQLCIGLLIILVAAYVIYRVYQGSQSGFVYILMVFAILIGVVDIGQGLGSSLYFPSIW